VGSVQNPVRGTKKTKRTQFRPRRSLQTSDSRHFTTPDAHFLATRLAFMA
jgi:hypothetical protein